MKNEATFCWTQLVWAANLDYVEEEEKKKYNIFSSIGSKIWLELSRLGGQQTVIHRQNKRYLLFL